jgi:prevent-host-death family protein
METKNQIIGLKELRENTDFYINAVKNGGSFVVVRKSKPVFRISSADEDEGLWETAIDFTKIKKGGVHIDEILSRI